VRAILVLSLFIAVSPAARAGKVEMCTDDACSSKVKREKLDCAIHKNKSKSLKFGFKLSTAFSASVGPEVTFGRTSEISWNGMSQELIRRYEVLCDMHNKSLVNLAQFNRRYDKLEAYFEKAKDIKEDVENTVDSRADKAHSELEAASAAHGGRAQAVAQGKAKVDKISAEIEGLAKEVAVPDEAVAIVATRKPAPLARGLEVLWPDLSTPARAVGGGENDAALVVGIENYDKVSDVPGAKTNAKEWYQYLTATRGIPPQNVKLLTDEDAAKEPILDQARKVAQRAGPKGMLWFIFVGHGAPSSDGKDGLLVGADARQTPESLQARSVPRGELLRVLGESKASSITVLLDACFSGRNQDGGALVAGLQPLQTVVTGGTADPRMVILTAAKGDQYAGALPGAKRPAFSYLALGGLRGWAVPASAPSVTAGDLRRYADDALEATLRGRKQEPDLMGTESAILGRSAGERAPDLAALALATAGGLDSGRKLKGAVPPDEEPASVDAARLQWVSIPGGSFMMGSENGDNDQLPRHKVLLPAFQMSKTMVTNKQYKACVEAGACKSGKNYGKDFSDDDQPVVGVDWSQADAFAKWVGGSLPSEAQWEYAARGAGKDTKYPWGNEAVTCERANLAECALGKTAPVCSKPAGSTPQGICDLAGNSSEWVQDWYHDSYKGAPEDGRAWEDTGTLRVIRGGSWTDGAAASRSVDRDNFDPSERRSSLGFRTVRKEAL